MKNSMRSLLVSMSCSVLVSSLSIGTAAAQSTNQPTNQQIATRIDSPYVRTSEELQTIAKGVRHELIMLPYYNIFDWLEGEVRADGTVVLKGEVVRPTTKSDAEKRVGRIEGVTNIINEIRVLPLSTMDDGLRIALYRAIFYSNSGLSRYGQGAVSPIHIIVQNGRATLKGVVGSQMDKQLAYMAARAVPGLFEVKDELVAEYPVRN